MNRRGVSPVIATVIIIMITIAAAGIIAPFAINFVNQNLDDSGSCFDVLGDISFAETVYNCHAGDNPSFQETGFSVRVDNDNIVGFKIAATQTGSSEVFEIREGPTTQTIRMLGESSDIGQYDDDLLLPGNGGTQTYVIYRIYSKLEIAPILANGKTCDVAQTIQIPECADADAITRIGA